MKKIFFSLFAICMTSAIIAQTKADDIIGEWLPSKKDGRVLIYKEGATYYGKITWGSGAALKDEKNPKPMLRSRNLIGLVILKGLVFDGYHTWEDGVIYDPRKGKTYSCKMTLRDFNDLNIRGYVGISLFGRTEVWTRFK